jgi:hypothetical protein
MDNRSRSSIGAAFDSVAEETTMSQIRAFVAAATVLVAGCAGAPEVAEQATTTATPIAGSAGAVATVAAVVPDAVVDIEEINASTSPPIICREMLKPNSNVHVQQCMTEADWKIYKRAEARRAEEITRMLQGGIYRR